MKTKKLLSLLLALMMMLSVVPFYASAAPIALTVANVTEWPTAVGEMYVGQIVGEHITITGGEVRYDADGDGVLEDTEIVPGHFEHFNATLSISLASDASKANIKFVPDDSTAYSGFNKLMSTDVTYVVKKTTAVLMDEANPPVATPIKEGQTLSESIISGGTMKNPYNEKLNLSSKVWAWVDPTQVITESGEYLAKWEGDTRAYEDITDYIYVEVEKDQKATELKTMPVVNFDYNPDLTWGTYEFAGATAVVYGTDTEVPGTFSIIDSWSHIVPGAGAYEVEVVFTPDDTENYIGFTTKVPVQIKTIPISFGEDHKGTSIDDPFVYEVEPGTTVRDAFPKGYLNYPTPSVVGIEDANSYVENGRVYKVTVLNYTNTNYTGSEAYVKFVFKDVEFAVSSVSYYAGTEKINVKFSESNFSGTFDVYVDGILVGDDIPRAGDHIDVPYAPETSGTHTVKVVYNPTENDYYFMADYETEIQANVERHITLKNMDVAQKVSVNGKEDYPSSAYILYGDEISIKYGFEDLFVSWVITDTAGKAVDLGVDLTSSEITFTMPDHDLVIAVKKTLDEEEKPDDGTGGGFDLDDIFGNLGDLTEGDSDNPIVNIFNNIIAFFKNIIVTITELFRSIGDNT